MGLRGSYFCRFRLQNCRDSDRRRRRNELGRSVEARCVDRAVRRLASGSSIHLPCHGGVGSISDSSRKLFCAQNRHEGARWRHRYLGALGRLVGNERRARAGAPPRYEANSKKYCNEQEISQAHKTTQRHEFVFLVKKNSS